MVAYPILIFAIPPLVCGLAIIIFRKALSKSHIIMMPAGFGGKSFAEKFGEKKGERYMLYFGMVPIAFAVIIAFNAFTYNP